MRPDGDYIRRRRRRIGLDQETFASRAGIDVKTLRRIESNQTARPQAATIRAIAGVLGSRPEELFETRRREPLDLPRLAPMLARCSSCGLQENDPSACFCRRCGQRARESEIGLRKPATVIAVRVHNLSELSARLDEESERRLLDAVHEGIRPAVQRFEGTLQRSTQGSSAAFGVPIAHEDHAARACRAALWLAAELPQLCSRLQGELGCVPRLGIGVHSGRIVLRGGESATGRVVEMAAALASEAPPGRIHLSEATYRSVHELFRIEVDASPPGRPARPRRYVLEQSSRMATRFDAVAARGLRPFVGRKRELVPLHAALREVSPSGGRVIAVVGDAGVGKSRLCHHFAEQVRALGWSVLRVVCPSHGRMVPLSPVLALTRQLLGLEPDAAHHIVQRAVSDALAGLESHADRNAAAKLLLELLELLEVAEGDGAAREITPQLRHELLFALIRDLLAARSREQRLVLVIEDAHWMDTGSQRFLAGLVAAMRGLGMLVIVNFRPEHLPSWLTSSSVDRIVLRPFERGDCEALVESLLGGEASDPALVRRIGERAGGNPLFAEEVVQMLVDEGHLVGEPGAYKPCGPIGELGLPTAVEDMVAARIDRLPPGRRHILHAAAVIGGEAAEPLLLSVSGSTSDELRVSLRELQWLDLLFEVMQGSERRFQFKHAIVQEVAYGSLLRETRCELHERAYAALVAQPGQTFEQLDARAHQALGAERWEDAARYFEQAATLSRRRAANAAAALYFERAVDALERAGIAHTARGAHLRLCWVQALIPLGEAERADAVLAAIRSDLVEPEGLAQIRLNQVYTYWVAGRYREALTRAEFALRAAEAADAVPLRIAAEFALGRVHYGMGDMRRGAAHLEKALAELAAHGLEDGQLGWPGRPAALIRGFLAHCLGEMGEFELAAAVAQAGLRAAERLRDPYGDVMVRLGAAHACRVQGDAKAAIELLRPAELACAEIQLRSLALAVAGELAGAQLALGQLEAARARLSAPGADSAPRLTHMRVDLTRAELALRTGDARSARIKATVVRDEAESQGDRGTQAYAALALDEIELAAPASAGAPLARAWIDEAERIAQALDLPPLRARCSAARARLANATE